MKNQEIMDFINDTIEYEYGTRIGLDDDFREASGLDSLSLTLVLVTLEDKFPDLIEDIEVLDMQPFYEPGAVTMRKMVKKCKLSLQSTDTEVSTKMAT